MKQKQNLDVTQLLRAYREGKKEVLPEIVPLIYRELRQLASSSLRKHASQKTLHTTDLVHEAYLRLAKQDELSIQDRNHFFALAATSMRNIMIDYARKKSAKKRGAAPQRIDLEEVALLSEERCESLLALDDALARLSKLDARQGRIVELRYFAGLSIGETAEVLDVSPTTVKREWRSARALLYNWLNQ